MSTLAVTALLSLINIGSAIAFNIVIALGGLGIITSNILVISLMLRKRLNGEPLLPSKFDLGKMGGFYVNIVALAYLFIPYVMICFPSIPNPSLIDMNWSSLMFGGLVIFAMVYYYLYGRHKYDGPVEYVKQS
jgi:choline transport protein